MIWAALSLLALLVLAATVRSQRATWRSMCETKASVQSLLDSMAKLESERMALDIERRALRTERLAIAKPVGPPNQTFRADRVYPKPCSRP